MVCVKDSGETLSVRPRNLEYDGPQCGEAAWQDGKEETGEGRAGVEEEGTDAGAEHMEGMEAVPGGENRVRIERAKQWVVRWMPESVGDGWEPASWARSGEVAMGWWRKGQGWSVTDQACPLQEAGATA